MGSNTEKKPWTNLQKSFKNLSKEIKSDNFYYRKVGRAITNFGGSNNIFAGCRTFLNSMSRHVSFFCKTRIIQGRREVN